jgi:hypothetical protein
MDGVSLITGFAAWGANISTILQDWEYMGVFEYVLPFLLVFAVIFGILHKSQIIGDYRGINMVIAFAIALISITSYQFRSFFINLFPLAGVGVSILLVGMIMVGLFVNSDDKWWKIVFYSIGMLIAVIIVISALSSYESFGLGAWWWREYLDSIIVGVIIIGLILLIVLTAKKSGSSGGKPKV